MLEKMREMRDEKGFTLIELLVVVVILVVLAAVAVPIFLGQKTKAQESADQSTLGAVSTVLKNGSAVGSTVNFTAADTSVGYAGDAGDQNISLSGANLYVAKAATLNARVEIVADRSVPATWCITKGGFQMTSENSAPVTGVCVL